MLRISKAEGGETWEIGNDGGRTALQFLANTLSEPKWFDNVVLRKALEEPLRWLGTYYLAAEKLGCGVDGLPYDPVARFHLRNGASMHRINVHGNHTTGGLQKSGGLMCNYLYSLSDLRSRHEAFMHSNPPGAFHRSEEVKATLEWK